MDNIFTDIHTHEITERPYCILSVRAGKESVPVNRVFVSAGIHPWDAGDVSPDALSVLKSSNICAVGETGLDKVNGLDFGKQLEVFSTQVDIAVERGLPVIIHCVKAYEEVMALLKKASPGFAIFHGFTGPVELMKSLTDKGYYLSFGHRTSKSPKTTEAFRRIEPERLFVETDNSGLPINEIYTMLAKIRGISVEELQKITFNNFVQIFGKE